MDRGETSYHTGFVVVNGAHLYYEVRGNTRAAETRLPVILVHGLSLDSRMWDHQFAALARSFVTYRYDLRGHGRSDPVTGPVALHDDMLGFMDALGIAKAHLVGLSLGGNAVSEVAAAHPERVGRVVLIDSGINGFAYPTPNVLQRIPAYLAINAEQGREAALRAWVQDPLFAVSYQSPRVRPALEALVLSCPCSLFFNPQFQIRPPTFERLDQIVAPTLVLVGERDQPEFQAAAAALDQHIPDSRKVVIERAGHMANLDQPRATTRELLWFLRWPTMNVPSMSSAR
ncbi:MAG: alpha/beta fold hydrolase [Chloroflexales bacterium]|nr:alpha/beta fold hydrolase [Chloroflexales bacterium]